MEDALLCETDGTPMQRLCRLFGVSDKAPQKKLNMFLRWMIRRDSEVDVGIWRNFSPCELIIPLDTHVSEMAFRLELTRSKSYTLNNARTITAALAEVFPEDPCLGDFALFGYGINELLNVVGGVFLETGSCGEDDYGISFEISGNLKIIPEGYHIHRGFSVFWLKVSIKLG